jgi:hypothetical protein
VHKSVDFKHCLVAVALMSFERSGSAWAKLNWKTVKIIQGTLIGVF